MEMRRPIPALTPFVSCIWASDGEPRHTAGTSQERVLPTGATHLVLRLDPEPLRLIEEGKERTFSLGVVGGIRSHAYLKDVRRTVPTVGVMLEPGAVMALFGVSADELAGTHTSLDEIWGHEAGLLVDELAAIPCLTPRLDRFERCLASRLPRVRGIHPGLAHALAETCGRVDRASALAERAGLGPRRFSQLFRESVGVSPKRWLRLQRFQRALAYAADPDLDWSEIAYRLGYSDQPHLAREFRDFSGLTPGEYRRLAPKARNHVPVDSAES